MARPTSDRAAVTTGAAPSRPSAAALVLIGDNLVWGASYPATSLALGGMSAGALAILLALFLGRARAPLSAQPAPGRRGLRR